MLTTGVWGAGAGTGAGAGPRDGERTSVGGGSAPVCGTHRSRGGDTVARAAWYPSYLPACPHHHHQHSKQSTWKRNSNVQMLLSRRWNWPANGMSAAGATGAAMAWKLHTFVANRPHAVVSVELVRGVQDEQIRAGFHVAPVVVSRSCTLNSVAMAIVVGSGRGAGAGGDCGSSNTHQGQPHCVQCTTRKTIVKAFQKRN